MVVAQIDGLSGTGKSTLSRELARRGHRAVDADAEFGYFGDPATGQPTAARLRANWIWDLGLLRAYCDRWRGAPIFICGGALNQDECADLFTHRLSLIIDDDTMRTRLLTRTTNDYGKDPVELAEQLELNRGAVSDARRVGAMIIDATRPLTEVADAVVRACLGPPVTGDARFAAG